MAELKTSLVVNLTGNIAARAREFSSAIGDFGRSSSRSLGVLRRTAEVAGAGLDRLGNRYTALLTGAVGIGAARGVINLERRFTRLGINAGIAADKAEELKQEIFRIAQAPAIRVDPSEITAAIEQIADRTDDLKFARENIENIGLAIQATGATGADIGNLIAELHAFGIVSQRDVRSNLDALIRQGNAGGVAVQTLATQFGGLLSVYAAAGRTAPTAARELGAVLSVVRQGVGGDAEKAAAAVGSLLNTLTDLDKVKQLRQFGIQVMDPKQPNVMRNLADIITDIVRATSGNEQALRLVFDPRAVKAFTAAAVEFNKTGSIASFKKFLDIQGDGAALMKNSTRAANDSAAAMRNALSAWEQFADRNLAGPIKDMADALNSVKPDTVQSVMKWLAWGAGSLFALAIGAKAVRGTAAAVRGLRYIFGAGGGNAGSLAGAIAGIQDVRVINWPATYSRSAGFGGDAGSSQGAQSAGRLARFGAGAAGALAAGTIAALTTPGGAEAKGGAFGGATGAVAGAQAGGLAGAALGAFTGPLAPIASPVLGAVGALGGGALGYFGGDWFGRAIGRWLSGDDKRKAAEAKVTIDINGLPPGSRAQVDTPKPSVDIDLNAGYTMGVP